eukprot:CAMPEP_0197007374 /NCGR_PEP_ID=MMETSP1380-20130617/40298_1 /TAXON_ID=5936 /ORGANISM="Euplotes crassus, Strain CT5" /LENGTH=106 /DNA_ID=CAMNT_0042427421 /DNA_START=54 /DNA_END=374 /DNA_ORIENTATION=-
MYLSIAEMSLCLEMKEKDGILDKNNELIEKVLNYTKQFNNSYSEEHTQAIRTLLSREGIREPEATLLWNLSPSTVEEAQSLIPGLKDYHDETIIKVLKEINGVSTT